jgi:hypothetical protein
MNIIEKLGITPGPWRRVRKVNEEDYHCVLHAPEMLEALIEIIDSSENGGRPYRGSDARRNGKSIIEKATGKSWTEIKELINED